jgi:hypothetical protein
VVVCYPVADLLVRGSGPSFDDFVRGTYTFAEQLSKNQFQEVTAMPVEMPKTGIDVLGDMPWGCRAQVFRTRLI